MYFKTYLDFLKYNFNLDYNGSHFIKHYKNVYKNCKRISSHYNINSKIFIYFSFLHDLKRKDEYKDIMHSKRSFEFVKRLRPYIKLNDAEFNILLSSIKNHNDKYYIPDNIIEKICLDADKLDLDRFGYEIKSEFIHLDFSKTLIK